MREIGSEFHYEDILDGEGIVLPQNVQDYTFTFSGRTSIETVLDNEIDIKTVMLPSYCCASMIEPFKKKNIKIYFYDVNYDGNLRIDISLDQKVDAILWCNYFGYRYDMPDLTSFIQQGGIIIEDITHSFFSMKKFDIQSEYLVASIRKWEPVLSGGYCASIKKNLKYRPLKLPSKDFLEKKKHAMIEKSRYLKGKSEIEKNKFLEEYNYSNVWLSENYSGLMIDNESSNYINNVDCKKNINQRKENAKILYEGLKGYSFLKPLFDVETMDCPLFVPVIIDVKERNKVRKFLIEHDIYCPVHWPKPNDECISNLYECELSLVCDQRYNKNDMERIINVLRKYQLEMGGK